MRGKTHVSCAVTAAFLFLRPVDLTSCICTAAGTALGGLLSDLDTEEPAFRSVLLSGPLLVLPFLYAFLFLDFRLDWGICRCLQERFDSACLAGVLLFVFGCAYGVSTSHRTFMHSLTAGLCFTFSLSLIFAPMALPFLIGFLSHLLLDLLGFAGLQLFYPAEMKFCLHLCSSNGKADRILGGLFF